MQKTVTLLLFVFFVSMTAFGQSMIAGKRLTCEGEMPQALKSKLSDSKDNYLKYLTRSGNIIYGSEVNRYIEQIVDNLLIKEPSLRNELTILVSKSPVVNAFVNAEGIILINIGLIAQASCEAEIAFVLSHELIHYVLKHDVRKKDPKESLGKYLSRHFYSREQETEADKKGIERFFSISQYSYAALDGAFDVLQFGHLPFDNLPFDRHCIEADCYQFPEKHFPKNINPINIREDYLDTLHTHPNIAKRRSAMLEIIAKRDNSNRNLFVQDSSLFVQIQRLCRIECLNLWLLRHDFAHAYYNAYLLEKMSPASDADNQIWKNVMAIALYGISKHKHDGSLSQAVPQNANVEGEQHAFVHFVREATQAEMSVLALRKLWEVKRQQPDNEEIDNMCQDIAQQIIVSNRLKLDDFCDYPMGTNLDSIATETQQEAPPAEKPTTTGKYGNIKQTASTTTKVKPSPKFKPVNYMLADLKQDATFTAFFQQQQRNAEDETVLQMLAPSVPQLSSASVAIIPPFFAYSGASKYLENRSLNGSKRLQNSITKATKRLGIPYFLIDNNKLETFNTEQYNNYCTVFEWLKYIYMENGSVLPYHIPDLEIIAPNSKYLLITVVDMHRQRRINYFKLQNVALTALCPPMFPAMLTQLLFERNSAKVLFTLFNLQTGKTEMNKYSIIDRTHSTESLTHAFIYDCLHQLKKGSKK